MIKESQLHKLFEAYDISKKDMLYYVNEIEKGNIDNVIDEFTEKYIVRPIDLYSAEMVGNLEKSTELLNSEDKNTIFKNIIYGTAITITLLNKNFQEFMKGAYRNLLDTIPSVRLRNTILDETIKQFQELTENAMTQTRAKVLQDVRAIQTDLIVQNQQLRNLPDVRSIINDQKKVFSKDLKRRHPDIYKQIESGDILTNVKGRKYKLSYYNEMATQTTLMNVDRKSVEVTAKLTKGRKGFNVVEYYQRDTKKLKSDARVICKDILSKKTFNKSLLAVDEETADNLGIDTIDAVKARPDHAMGVNCRHSIKSVSKQYVNSIKKAVA